MNLLLFVLGLASLVAGASLLVRGASKLALSFGISPLVVGLTIVAFGTSAPEVAVIGRCGARRQDRHRHRQRGREQHFQRAVHPRRQRADYAARGQHPVDQQEVPIMVGASLLLLVLGLDGRLGLWDAAFSFRAADRVHRFPGSAVAAGNQPGAG